MREWIIAGKIVKFPSDWGKKDVMKWVNNGGIIRMCLKCEKLDVTYDHFNECNPNEQYAIHFNREW